MQGVRNAAVPCPGCLRESRMRRHQSNGRLPVLPKHGTVLTYTGDMLAASYNPPAIYGAVAFEGGGKCYFDFTDCNLADLATGTLVSMSFRRKYYDKKRQIAGYFWKAVPIKEVA